MSIPAVVDFDCAKEEATILSGRRITTGSHATLFGAYLGYRTIYLLGIDCDYVQVVSGAQHVEAREGEDSRNTLEIQVTPERNPNYFFDDYQQKGDRYNVPNPGRSVHLSAWREAAVALRHEGVKVLNANLSSKVDAFDFCDFDAIGPGGPPVVIPRETVLGEVGERSAEGEVGERSAELALGRVDGALRGTFEVNAQAQFDEIGFVARLMLGATEGTMVDVGAHRGASTRRFAEAGWKVIAHEPDPDNRRAFEAYAQGRGKVVVDARAVTDKSDQEVKLYASPESTGISSLLAFRDSHAVKCIVRTCTIADVVHERMLERIDVLKIDAEGYELPILRGVPWDRLQPEVVICEYEDRKTHALDYRVDDLARFLELKGYWVLVSEWHPIEKYGGPHSWKRLQWYSPGQCDGEGWGNLIAFRSPTPLPELLAAADQEIRVLAQPPESRAASRNVLEKQSMNSRLLRPVKRLFRGNKVVRWGSLGAVFALAATSLVAAMLVLPAAEAALVIAVITFVAAGIGLPATVALTRKEARRRKQLRGALAASQERIATLERLLKQARDALSEQRTALELLMPGRAPHLAAFSRCPDAAVIARLTETWAPKLGLRAEERELNYLAHRLRTIEANGIGRMATSIEAAMLRILSARAVGRDRLDVLEIGTLFGLGAAAVYEGTRGRFEQVHLTLIDPLQGYYGAGRPDPLTGAIADREALLCNLRQAGVPVEDVTIIQGQSEEEAVRAEAAEHRYDLLIIDGDHSAKGVARDFDQYAPLVRESGFVLFDDYDVPEWPAIKAFVDEQVADRTGLDFLGGEFRTAVFKVRSVLAMPADLEEPLVAPSREGAMGSAAATTGSMRSEGLDRRKS